MLHDAEAEQSLVVVFVDTEDDYKRGDATLNAMPAGDTPGRRTSVEKYDIAIRIDRLNPGSRPARQRPGA